MDLPMVQRSYAPVDVVGFYQRATLTVDRAEGSSIVYSDRTPFTAYAERCRKTTATIPNDDQTRKLIESMNFRDFCERVKHTWIKDSTVTPEDLGPQTKRRFLTRDATTGSWLLKLRGIRQHIRPSTVLHTEPAYLYTPVDEDDPSEPTTFFEMATNRRKQLYRCYYELVFYVPWSESPEATFLDDEQRQTLASLLLEDPSEREQRYSLRRLEMFHRSYMRMWNAEPRTIAPPGSDWHHDNAYSYSMYLANGHNSDMHTERVRNDGVLKAQFDPADELDGTTVDIHADPAHAVDESEFPSSLNYLPSDTFHDITEQPPPTIDEVSSKL